MKMVPWDVNSKADCKLSVSELNLKVEATDSQHINGLNVKGEKEIEDNAKALA